MTSHPALLTPPSRDRRRPTAVVAVSAIVAAVLFPLGAAPAGAATMGDAPDQISTGFEIDGNKTATNDPTDETFDWDDFITGVDPQGGYTFTPTGPYQTADGYDSTGIIAGTFAWDNGTLDAACDANPDASAFPGSVKPNDNPWNPAPANVIGKTDGCSIGTAYEVVTDDNGVDHHILYQYWTRLEGNGDMTTYLVLEGGSVGRCDDKVVEFNYDPAGNPATQVTVYEWVEVSSCAVGAQGAWSAVQPNFAYDAAVGARAEGPDLPAEPETFGEVAIDLTDAGLFDEGSCTAFTATGYVTRTGNKVSAELGDAVGIGTSPLVISNCGMIEVSKEVDPAGGTDETFDYSITRGGEPVHDGVVAGTVLGTGAEVTNTWDGAADAGIAATIGAGQTHRWSPVFAGQYDLDETLGEDSDFVTQSVVCTTANPAGRDIVTTLVADGEPTDLTFPVLVGQLTSCVITNATSYLTISKTAIGGAGTFGFDLTGDDAADVSVAAGATSAPIAYPPGTAVTITELLDALNGASSTDLDWAATSVVCSDETEGDDGEVTVTTVAGETIDCEFTNTRQGSIVVTKVVEGETADATFDFTGDWTTGTPELAEGAFSITTARTTTGIVESQTFLNVAPGSYALGESAVTGFDTTNLVCVDPDTGTVVVGFAATIDLDPGETVSCTFTNTERGMILVDKDTLPADYDQSFDFAWGPAAGATTGFTLDDSTDAEDEPWSTGLIVPGDYVVTETDLPAGWSLTSIDCGEVDGTSTALTLPAGAVVTCTFLNTADPGSVSLSKTVEGVADGFDWSFPVRLVGPAGEVDEQSVTTEHPVAQWDDLLVGATYTLREGDLPDGWSAGPISCTGTTDADPQKAGYQFVVTPGLELECALTNTAAPATLELTKTVEGVADTVDWSFEVTISPDPVFGTATQTVSGTGDESDTATWGLLPGVTYTVSETGLDGWTEGEITCTGVEDESDAPGLQVIATPGIALDCAVTNTADPGEIVVTKTADGGDGTFVFHLQPLDADGKPAGEPLTASAVTSNGSGTATFSGLLPGSRFAISEVDPGESWIVGDLACLLTPAGSTAAADVNEGDVTVHPGDAISCAITNTATATITIVKVVEGDDAEFEFTGNWLDPTKFMIETESGTGTASFVHLAPGDYEVAEEPGSGYDGTDLVCSDEQNTAVDLAKLTASITLLPGATVVCTFTNSEWGVLIVDKVTAPAGAAQPFDFEWAASGESATSFERGDLDEPYGTGPLAPGSYTVTELAEAGWVLTDLTCTDTAGDDGDNRIDGATATVRVGLGETVLCTFTNAQRGPLTVDKEVSGGAATSNGDGTYTVVYDLTVTSESYAPEQYDLDDEFDFGDGITVLDATVTSDDGLTVNPSWDGKGTTRVVSDATIEPRDTHSYTVTVTVDAAAPVIGTDLDCEVEDGEGTGLFNSGRIAFGEDATDSDDACAPLPIADIGIDKSAELSFDLDPEGPGVQVAFTLTVTNFGPAVAEKVTLSDAIPTGVSFVSAVGDGATCALVGGTVECDLGDLAVDDTVVIVLTVFVPASFGFGPLVNVASTSTVTPESDLENNQDDATTVALPTLSLPPDGPDLETLALTGATTLGVAWAVGLLALGATLLVLRFRGSRGRHSA